MAFRRFSRRPGILTLVIWGLMLYMLYRREIAKNVLFSDTYSHDCPIVPPELPYFPTKDPTFDWRGLKPKWELPELHELSRDKPKELRRVQHAFGRYRPSAERIRRQKAVKDTFKRSWKAYKERAWRHDQLSPVSGNAIDPYGGWGATLVDSLDTLWIMGLRDEFREAVDTVSQISFSPNTSTSDTINVFEATIRYLGGFMSAFDLTGCKEPRLLDKALEVGNMIFSSYDTPNRMPRTRWDPRKAAKGVQQDPAKYAVLAELGTMSLEFTRLSQLTGHMRFYNQMLGIAYTFQDQQDKTTLPGMWPVDVDAMFSDLTVGSYYSFSAMSDSAYEYLPKMYQLSGGINAGPKHAEMYRKAMQTATKYMFFRPMLPDNANVRIVTNVHMHEYPEKDYRGEHLSCFVGGMLALGGKLLDIPDHVTLGRQVTDGCIWAYKNSRYNITPEIFTMMPCDSDTDCTWDQARFDARAEDKRFPGFTSIVNAKYDLRPEVIESVFYLYRITGDESLLDDAWDMFQAIEKYTRTEFANAAIADVTADKLHLEDNMESFWLGETLKYFYLIFSDPKLINLDDFVFNTEAHPFRRPQ